jgi:glutamate--cysteine ligase
LYQQAEQRLSRLEKAGLAHLLRGGGVGVEKETLRVSPAGCISRLPHPLALGSPLTHPYLTTDYSEALIELITPPLPGVGQALEFLHDAQKFVCDHLDHEILWATSMPCVLEGEDSIPIAEYGSSNLGMMKTVYRRGLGHRYGKAMQVIAGMHFNYSLPLAFWPAFQELEGDRRPYQSFVAESYFALIRNLLRVGWLVPYLFGASPAVCKSFLGGRPTRLQEFDETTYYEPFATSLRMGDIGYQNSKELGAGVKADYSSLDAYVASLTRAIESPSPQYQKIGVKVNGRYEQLNANILQIENEYYSSVRPKQIPQDNEKPSLALLRRGVRYVELRSPDVNAFEPLGMSKQQARFLEALMVFCLLAESPVINLHERQEIDRNLGGVAHRGRDPSLYLQRNGLEVKLRDWGREILQAMRGVCELLDGADPDKPYTTSLQRQRELMEDPDLTPSARMLAEMRERGEGFFGFAQRMSMQHQKYFCRLQLSPERRELFLQETERSLQRQREIEAADGQSFGEFLADYFAQR